MKGKLKQLSFYFLVIVAMLAFFPPKTQAFSLGFNPVTFLERTTNIVVNRFSDLIYYMMMQKQYLFNGYKDPNVYNDIDIPADIEAVIASSTVVLSVPVKNSIKENKVASDKPTPVTTTTVPNIKKENIVPKAPKIIPKEVVPLSPVIVVKSEEVLDSDEPSIIETLPAYANNSEILMYTNKERKSEGINTLSANPNLDKIATLRVEDLFENQYFEHESPDEKSATDLAKQLGYDYLLIGENLALGNFGDDQGIVTAWMNSPGHKANILNEKYTELGVSVKSGIYKGDNTIIAVQIFAKPSSNCPKPASSIKENIDNSSTSIKQAQKEANTAFDNLNAIKNSPNLDRAYYNQKISEYNYLAKKVNDAVLALKVMVDDYNLKVGKYNSCIGSK